MCNFKKEIEDLLLSYSFYVGGRIVDSSKIDFAVVAKEPTYFSVQYSSDYFKRIIVLSDGKRYKLEDLIEYYKENFPKKYVEIETKYRNKFEIL